MNISIRNACLQDVKYIIDCGWPGVPRSELQKYCNIYFGSDGKPKGIPTGYPEKVWVAKSDDRIVGYLHFFTDCWDGYATVVLSLVVDSSLPSEEIRMIREKLETELRLSEP